MSKPNSLLQRGTSEFKAGKYEEAIKLYTEAMNTPSTKVQALDSRAAAYMKLGKLPDALKDAKQCIDLAPKLPAGYVRAARVFKQLNKPDSALKMIDYASKRVTASDTRRLAELKKLKDETLALQAEITRLLKATACHLAVLPVEILTEIFVYMLEDDWDAPLRMGAVCKHWRSVAQGTPVMWTKLRLGGTTNNVERRMRAKAAQWDAKSRGHVKHIEFTGQQAMAIYAEYCSSGRFRSLEAARLILNPGDQCKNSGSWHLADLPKLAVFAFSFPDNIRNACNVAEEDVGRLARLRQLEATSFDLIFESQPTFPFLESLHLDLIHLSSPARVNLRTVLQACPVLQHLHISDRGIGLDHPPPDAVRLPFGNLKSLELHGRVCHSPIWSRMLPASVALDRLILEPLQSAALVLAQFSTATLSTLRELRILAVSDAAPLDLLAYLQAMPRLAVLQLSRASGDMAALLDALATAGLPLEDVDFSHCARLTGGALVRLVRARVGGLRAVRVDGCPLVEAETLPWLRSQVPRFSCVYMTRKQAKGQRFLS